MRAEYWGILLGFLFFFPGLHGESTCSDTIHVQCPNAYQVLITNIAASSSLAENALKQCNARQECQIENPKEECVEYSNYCRDKQETLVISEAIHSTPITESLFSIMSEDYHMGKTQDAKNINCDLRVSEDSKDILRTMQITMLEFSPFANSTDYCFYVRNSKIKKICSGSKKFVTTHGPFYGIKGWQLEMNLTEAATQVPAVRFWIDIDISPNEDVSYHLECRSRPVMEPTNPYSFERTTSRAATANFSATTTISAVLGSLLLMAVMALIIGSALTCRKNKIKSARKKSTVSLGQLSSFQGDSPYTYIDINGLATGEEFPRVLHTKEELAALSKSCETLPGFKMHDRRLPSPPRERQHHDMEYLAPEHPLLGAVNQDADGSNVDESSESDTEYLPSREELQALEDQTDQAVTKKNNHEPVHENPCEDAKDDGGGTDSKEVPCTEEQGTEAEGNQVLPENDDKDTEEPETTNAMTQDNDEDLEPDVAKLPENVYTHLSEDSLLDAEQRSRRTTYMRLECEEGKDNMNKVDEEGGQGVEKTVESGAPADAPARAPADASVDAPADASTDAPARAPADASTDAPANDPEDAPADAPVDNENTAEEIASDAKECPEKIGPEKRQYQEKEDEEEPKYLVLISGDLDNTPVSSEVIVAYSKDAEK